MKVITTTDERASILVSFRFHRSVFLRASMEAFSNTSSAMKHSSRTLTELITLDPSSNIWNEDSGSICSNLVGVWI